MAWRTAGRRQAGSRSIPVDRKRTRVRPFTPLQHAGSQHQFEPETARTRLFRAHGDPSKLKAGQRGGSAPTGSEGLIRAGRDDPHIARSRTLSNAGLRRRRRRMAIEWWDTEPALGHIQAVTGVSRDRAQIELAQHARHGRTPTQGIVWLGHRFSDHRPIPVEGWPSGRPPDGGPLSPPSAISSGSNGTVPNSCGSTPCPGTRVARALSIQARPSNISSTPGSPPARPWPSAPWPS